MSSLPKTLTLLVQGMAPEMRDAITRRYETFARELDYMERRGHKRWADVTAVGWSKRRLETVAALVAFHDIALGPLRAVAIVRRSTRNPLAMPVVAGSLRIDNAFVAGVEPMLETFDRLLDDLDVPQAVLGSHSARDLVYWLIRARTGGM